MSLALEILSELAQRGVTVRADGDALKLRPAKKVDDALLARVREAKPAILEALRNHLANCGSPHCAGCYDVGDGRKIHTPKCGEEYRTWLERWQPKGKTQ